MPSPSNCMHSFQILKSNTNHIVWHCNLCRSGPHWFIFECTLCKLKTCRPCTANA
ncbi:hypothetical protein BJ546DRAFT_849341 [Cryomyces antarcticus]